MGIWPEVPQGTCHCPPTPPTQPLRFSPSSRSSHLARASLGVPGNDARPRTSCNRRVFSPAADAPRRAVLQHPRMSGDSSSVDSRAPRGPLRPCSSASGHASSPHPAMRGPTIHPCSDELAPHDTLSFLSAQILTDRVPRPAFAQRRFNLASRCCLWIAGGVAQSVTLGIHRTNPPVSWRDCHPAACTGRNIISQALSFCQSLQVIVHNNGDGRPAVFQPE